MAAAETTLKPIPKPLMWVGTPIAAIVLTLFFVFLGFPYDLVASRMTEELEAATGARVSIGALRASVSMLGPGLTAEQVFVRTSGETLRADSVRVRPAWSLSWLALDPAVHIDLASETGNVIGTVYLGSSRGYAGRVENFDLDVLPLDEMLAGLGVSGRLDAEGDVRLVSTAAEEADDAPATAAAEELVGPLHLEVRDGALALPGTPLGIPFDLLTADLVFGEGQLARVVSLALEGPMITATLKGTIGQAARSGQEPLDLTLELHVKEQRLRSTMRSFGVKLNRDANATVSVTGTLGRPSVQ